MPTEQRVISSKPTIGQRPAPAGATSAAVAEGEAGTKAGKKPKKLVVVIAAAVLLLGGGAAYWFLMGPGAASGEAAEAAEPAPEPGEVLVVEPVSLNLAGGHYLRLGMGLQMTADAGAHGEIDTARALDLAISLFSGRPVEEVSSPEGREALKVQLLEQLGEAYHGEVMDLYFTDYVTQ